MPNTWFSAQPVLSSIFESNICCKYDKKDHECMPMMKLLEDDTLDEILELKEIAKREHSEDFPDADAHGWVSTYQWWLKEKLNAKLQIGLRRAALHRAHPTTLQQSAIHASCRTVTILHEELHLIAQGVDIPSVTAKYGETIGGGSQ